MESMLLKPVRWPRIWVPCDACAHLTAGKHTGTPFKDCSGVPMGHLVPMQPSKRAYKRIEEEFVSGDDNICVRGISSWQCAPQYVSYLYAANVLFKNDSAKYERRDMYYALSSKEDIDGILCGGFNIFTTSPGPFGQGFHFTNSASRVAGKWNGMAEVKVCIRARVLLNCVKVCDPDFVDIQLKKEPPGYNSCMKDVAGTACFEACVYDIRRILVTEVIYYTTKMPVPKIDRTPAQFVPRWVPTMRQHPLLVQTTSAAKRVKPP
jgi:hypothetical protein